MIRWCAALSACVPLWSGPTLAEPTGIAGLWGAETTLADQVAGTLTLDLRSGRADIGGFHTTISRRDNAVTLSLPGGQGRFRGTLEPGGATVRGFWIQPATVQQVAYASPLTLRREEPGVWTGNVHPLPDRLSQYIRIERTPDGSLTAFIRNPEANFAREHRLGVQVAGQAVTFSDPKRPHWQLHARLDADTGQLQVNWQGIGIFGFTRRDRDRAVGFYARTPAETTYLYRRPIVTGDGWQTASLREAGLDEQKIAALLARLEKTAGRAGPQVQALLIARHGKLVLDEYFYGFGPGRVHDTRSAGKSFASLMIGLAMAHGHGLSPQTPILSLLPPSERPSDPRKAKITVGDLMTMTSGLACDDGDPHSPGNEDTMQGQHREADWYRYVMALPMAREPGGRHAVYCSAGINLLGAAVKHATGMWLPAFFDTTIARPLQIRRYYMNLMPDGDAYLAGGIYLRPRDFLKLGQLYLSGGTWNGKRVISREWIARSTTRHSEFTPDHGYGYAWHLHEMKAGGRVFHEYAAEGNGGQFVIVVPQLDLVVGIAAGNYGDFRTWYKLQNLVRDDIIPAALAAP